MTATERNRRVKLRLVHDRHFPNLENSTKQQVQLVLPLAIPHSILVVGVAGLRFRDLDRLLKFSSPSWVLDFRRIARFDNLAGGRPYAFRLFANYGSNYLDVMGLFRRGMPFKEYTRISLWHRLFKAILNGHRGFSGPFLVICEQPEDFAQISSYVLKGMEKATGCGYLLSFVHQAYLNDDVLHLKVAL